MEDLSTLPPDVRLQVDREKLLEDGYLILRGLVEPAQLEQLRSSVEKMVDRRKAASAESRTPDEPPGGAWATSPQPRLKFDENFDGATVDSIGFCVQENTLGVIQYLMDRPAAVTYMACICNPEYDHGPARWHRDTSPPKAAPLGGLTMNTRDYGPGYLQWNVPLYNDSVFWVVPGSHRRINTEAETRQLAEDSSVPLPGSVPVDLQAGDGVVYIHMMLHWGSNYSRKLRRTVHLGYRGFGGGAFPVVHWRNWKPEIIQGLPGSTRATFEGFDRLFRGEIDDFEAVFRAVVHRDAAAFENALARLHPGETGRMVSVVLLSKLAFQLQRFKQLDHNTRQNLI